MTVQGKFAPVILLDGPPPPPAFREPFDEAVDEVAAWLTFVRFAATPWLDDDMFDPTWPYWADWERMCLVERVGLESVDHVLTTRDARETLYERGPSFTMWRPPTPTGVAVAGVLDRAVEVPRPVTREQIDDVLDQQVGRWPRRQSLDEVWDAYDLCLANLAVSPDDTMAQYGVRMGAALLAFDGVTPDPDEDAAIQAAVRAIDPAEELWPESFAAYRARRR